MPTNFVLGQIFMLIGAREIESRRNVVLTFPLKAAVAYSAVIFVPVTAWYFYAYPAWSTVYLKQEFMIPLWAGPLIVLQYLIGMIFGSLLAQSLIQLGHKRFVWITLALGIFWLAGIWIFTLDEYLHVGTFLMYHSGAAQVIFSDRSFLNKLNFMGAILAVPAILVAAILRRRSRV